jgi:hypothetical protein
MDHRTRIHRRLAYAGALAAAAGALAFAGAAGASGSSATAARTVTLNDTGHLRETSHKNFYLNYSGQASGSVGGTLYLHLHVISTNRFTAEVSLYPHGSSISGTASGSYRNQGATASFTGTLTVTHGSGSYSGAHGSGISFHGATQRVNGATTVSVSGHFSS